ncbi:MAG: HNH endonuclease [Chloroflexi bacterium]|nr:HNH endonuclease [Chloroflexota bacterium]
MHSRVLVLNASYEPLSVVSVRRAVSLLLRKKAEIVEAAESMLRSMRAAMEWPLVIRLVYFVRISALQRPAPFTRRGVLLRDRVCQYCGGTSDLTIDHVQPLSRGGASSWANCVAACGPCNRRKADRSPEEAGMRLSHQPYQPRYLTFVLSSAHAGEETWRKYLAR